MPELWFWGVLHLLVTSDTLIYAPKNKKKSDFIHDFSPLSLKQPNSASAHLSDSIGLCTYDIFFLCLCALSHPFKVLSVYLNITPTSPVFTAVIFPLRLISFAFGKFHPNKQRIDSCCDSKGCASDFGILFNSHNGQLGSW